MKSPIVTSAYKTLLNEICLIYENAQSEAAFAVNKLLVEAYWKIGKRIVTVEQKNKNRAEYGAHLLQKLSEDLTEKYPKGFSRRNLTNMRQFYLAYPIRQTSAKLDWSTYQVLSTVKDPTQRTAYERKAIEQGWTSRELAAVIKQDHVALEQVSLPPHPATKTKQKKLPAVCGQLNLAKIIEVEDIHNNKSCLEVDMGFYHTLRIPPKQLGNLHHGQIVELLPDKTGLSLKVKPGIKPAQRYTYQAAVLKVIDGDTLKVKINFGRAASIHPRLRLRGINTPELPTKKGIEAKSFVEKRLSQAKFIIIKTHSTDTSTAAS